MKKIIFLLLFLNLTLFADFFNSAKIAEEKDNKEREHFCQIFTQKAIDYQKNMREDELAYITLQSYKKRASIYCKKEEKPVEISQDDTSNNLQVEPIYRKEISLEDKRLCKIFMEKLDNYKKYAREDELSKTTMASLEKRTQVFCSEKTLEEKEKQVLQEDKKLCKVFQQGPVLCQKFDQNYTLVPNDSLAKETLESFKKREKVFCSSKPLEKKDMEVYQEHNRLCNFFSDKIISYQKNMRNDALAYQTLESYKKRASYFCATKNPKNTK